MNEQGWSADWPESPGFYWFYGHNVHMRRGTKRLYAVTVFVRSTPQGNPEIVYGYFAGALSRFKGAGGMWQRIAEPELPERNGP